MPQQQTTTTAPGARHALAHSHLLGALEWLCIGPYRGGRVVAVAGDPVDPAVFYFGACAGGGWKTTDAGTYWENVSDASLRTAAVGAIAVSDADSSVIYVGMGECCIRGDVSQGDGVYKSTTSRPGNPSTGGAPSPSLPLHMVTTMTCGSILVIRSA